MNKIKMDLTKELPYAVEESINRLRINVSFLGNEIKKIKKISIFPEKSKKRKESNNKEHKIVL